MNKSVIYTAIFGGSDELLRPKVVPPGFDFVCFVDEESARHPSFQKNADIWDVRIVPHTERDRVRDARKHKVLAHRYLKEYEHSVWIDGNIVVRGDVNELIREHLKESNMAVYDHNQLPWDAWDCLYIEADKLIALAATRVKDDPELIRAQVARYKSEGYPEHNGLLVSMIMLRRHNESDVVEAMEAWWHEIEKGSRRDQLSFNYVAWKHGLAFVWLPGNSRDNQYFKHQFHPRHRVTFARRLKLVRTKIRRILGG